MEEYNTCLVPGTFLFIHPGHIYLFKRAKKLCKRIVVVLSHDKRVEQKYGIKGTIKDRKEILESIKYVDEVVEGKEKNMLDVLEETRPDAIIFCSQHDIPKHIMEKISHMDVAIEKIECYKKEIYSNRNFFGE